MTGFRLGRETDIADRNQRCHALIEDWMGSLESLAFHGTENHSCSFCRPRVLLQPAFHLILKFWAVRDYLVQHRKPFDIQTPWSLFYTSSGASSVLLQKISERGSS